MYFVWFQSVEDNCAKYGESEPAGNEDVRDWEKQQLRLRHIIGKASPPGEANKLLVCGSLIIRYFSCNEYL